MYFNISQKGNSVLFSECCVFLGLREHFRLSHSQLRGGCIAIGDCNQQLQLASNWALVGSDEAAELR